MPYKTWKCGCGQEIVAEERPQPMKWNDRHICQFYEQKEPGTVESVFFMRMEHLIQDFEPDITDNLNKEDREKLVNEIMQEACSVLGITDKDLKENW